MSHPHTSEVVGFRQFNKSSFGELTPTNWEFDGTSNDVREFANQNIGQVETIRDVGQGTFDIVTETGDEYRVYTRPTSHEDPGSTIVLPKSGLTIGY